MSEYQLERIANTLERIARLLEQKAAPTPSVPVVVQGCPVCGIGKLGQAMGYVCARVDCPTRGTAQ